MPVIGEVHPDTLRPVGSPPRQLPQHHLNQFTRWLRHQKTDPDSASIAAGLMRITLNLPAGELIMTN